MTQQFLGITWGYAQYIYLLAIVFLMIGILWYRAQYTKQVLRILTLKNFSFMRYGLRAGLIGLAFFGLFFAVLRPQWGQKEIVIKQEGRDLFIALDVSRSMLAADLAPNRLAIAKQKIKQLIPLLDCERIGLILFSGDAFVQCPLTIDYQAFTMFLDSVDAETISSGSTDIAQPIYKALDMYRNMPNKAVKLLVIFTDGEDFSPSLADCTAKIKEENLKVFTVGVGTSDGAPIPLFDPTGNQIGHQKDHYDKVVITRLNEEILREVAHAAGATYLQLTQDEADLKKLISCVQRFDKEMIEDKNFDALEDKYHYFLMFSFLCLALEWVL